MYTRSNTKTMWAGHYKIIDIHRRLQSTSVKASTKSIRSAIQCDDLEDEHRCGRPRTVRTQKNMRALRQTLVRNEYKPCNLKQLRAKLAKTAGIDFTLRTLRLAKRDLGYTGRRGKKKPERAFFKCNRDKRVEIAKERVKWTDVQLKKVIWIDQSQCSRDGVQIFQQRKGQPYVHCPVPDNKEEKVHYVVAIVNGWKSKIEMLPVRVQLYVMKMVQQFALHSPQVVARRETPLLQRRTKQMKARVGRLTA